MKYKLSIYSEFDDGTRTRIYYELGDDEDQLKSVAGAYIKDDEFNKKLIQAYCSSQVAVTLEEMNNDGSWTLILEYIDFL